MTSLPSWDLFLTLFFMIGIAYGLILQKDKTILTLISVYVALVVVNAVAPTIQLLLTGEETIMGQVFIKSDASPFTVKIVLFVLIVALVSTKSGLSGEKTGGILSPIELFCYSFATTMLIASSIFSFMPETARAEFASNSHFAKIIITNGVWWALLPVILLIVSGFIHKGK